MVQAKGSSSIDSYCKCVNNYESRCCSGCFGSVTTSVATNLNWQQVDTGSAPDTGLDSRYYGSIIAATAGKKVMASQWILNEDMRHLLGKKVRVSIKHNMKVGTSKNFKLGLLQLTSAGTIDTSPAFLSGAWSVTTGAGATVVAVGIFSA